MDAHEDAPDGVHHYAALSEAPWDIQKSVPRDAPAVGLQPPQLTQH